MPKPNINFTVIEIKEYIRTHKLNHPRVKLSLTKPQLIAGLKLIDHWDDTTAKTKKKRIKKAPPTKPKMSKEDDVRPVDKKVSTPPTPPPVSKPSKGIKVGKPPPNVKKEILRLSDKVEPKKQTNAPATTWRVNKAKRTRLNTAFRASQSKNKKSIYVVLGMDANSDPSPDEVKQACRKLKLKHHPDKGGDADIFDLVQKACDIFIESFK